MTRLAAALRARLHDLLALLAMAVLFGVQFEAALRERLNLTAFQDNVYLLSPLFRHVDDSFRRGEYPYWMDSVGGGLPLYDTAQFSITYPFYFFGAGLYTDPLQTMLWLNRISLLHLFILQLNSFVMLRLLRVSAWPAALGACLLAFSPNMVQFSTWANAITPYTWFPLVVAGVALIAQGRRSWLGIVLGGTSLALLVLASPAHALIHAIYVGAFVQAWNVVRLGRAGAWRPAFVRTGQLFAMGLLALALAAPGVLPAALHQDQMIRFGAEEGGAVPFGGFLEGQLGPSELAGALLPLTVTTVVGHPYVGTGVLLLACFGLWCVPRQWVLGPLAAIGAYGLLSSTGQHLGLAYFNHALPLINLIREPPRHLVLFVLASCTLAAFGADWLDRQVRTRRRVVAQPAAWVALALLVGAILVDHRTRLELMPEIVSARFTPLYVAGLALLLATLLLAGPLGRATLVAGCLLVLATNMQFPLYTAQIQGSDYFQDANLESHQVLEELARLPDSRGYRFFFAGGTLNQQFWSMNGSFHGLRSFQAYMNPLPARQFEETFERSTLPNYYPLLGGRYYLCENCAEPPPGYRLLRRIGRQRLHAHEGALPRYLLLSSVAGTYEQPEEFYERVADPGFDYSRRVYLPIGEAEEVSEWLGGEGGQPRYRIKEERRSDNLLQLSVVADRNAILLLNEYLTSDWTATVNGYSVPLHRINLNQIGVLLEAGASLVTFEYRPALFVWLLRLQHLSFLLLCLHLLHRCRLRMRALARR